MRVLCLNLNGVTAHLRKVKPKKCVICCSRFCSFSSVYGNYLRFRYDIFERLNFSLVRSKLLQTSPRVLIRHATGAQQVCKIHTSLSFPLTTSHSLYVLAVRARVVMGRRASHARSWSPSSSKRVSIFRASVLLGDAAHRVREVRSYFW